MRNGKLLSVMGASALVVGLALGAGAEPRGKSKPKAEGKAEGKTESKAEAKGKGKAGDPCKVADDCDQSSRPMRCRQAGDSSTCVEVPIHPVT